MVLAWDRRQTASTSPLFSDFWALVDLSPGVTLKRVVLNAFITNRTGDSDSLSYWVGRGIVTAIEVTYGSPPPFPEDPATTFPGERDFIHWGLAPMNLMGQSTFPSTTADAGGMIHVDTPVQRVNHEVPATVWWSWGVQGGAPPGLVTGALSRFASSVLVDAPDVPGSPSAVSHQTHQ